MSSFVVNFDSQLAFVACGGSNCASSVEVETCDASKSQMADPVLVDTAKSIDANIAQTMKAVAEQNEILSRTALAYATEIARALLGNVDELVEKRIQHAVSIAIAEFPTMATANVFVHPGFEKSIRDWAASNVQAQIEITGDESLPEGDCRIDFGETGYLASLDSQLKLIQKRIVESFDQGGAS